MKHARPARFAIADGGAAAPRSRSLVAACGSGRSSSDNTTNDHRAPGGTHRARRRSSTRRSAIPSTATQGVTRQHDQDRHEPAPVGHLLGVQRDPEGRVGVLLVPQRAGRRDRRGQEVQDPARQQGRRLRRGEDVDERQHADQQRQGVRAVQHRRHEEQPRHPRDGQLRLRSRSAIASGAVQWGNTKYPWMLGSELVPYPLEMQMFVDYLKKNKPNAKIALLYANDDFGQSYKRDARRAREGHRRSRS